MKTAGLCMHLPRATAASGIAWYEGCRAPKSAVDDCLDCAFEGDLAFFTTTIMREDMPTHIRVHGDADNIELSV